MKVVGIAGMAPEQVAFEVQRGGKFVYFQYCVSLLVITFKRPSNIYFIRAGESAVSKGLPFSILSLLLGWWGIPWGLIWTPMVIFTNFRGGKDVTNEVVSGLQNVKLAA
jgi:hypothetical protein